MNPTELKELARTFVGIADGKPWQFTTGVSGPWIDADAKRNDDPVDKISRGLVIRLKPWEIGRSINGHTLPPGAEWHRQDFTEDMLPPPYRPIIKSEPMADSDEFGDDYRIDGTMKWKSFKGMRMSSTHMRTTRPIPFALTPQQIADGWVMWSGGECPVEPESRPTVMYRMCLTIDEVTTRAGNLKWDHSNGGGAIIAYKPDPVECYRIKEPQWIPLGPEDVPPGSIISTAPEAYFVTVSHRGPASLSFHNGAYPEILYYADLESNGWQINRPRHRDADGNPTLWEPCRKQSNS